MQGPSIEIKYISNVSVSSIGNENKIHSLSPLNWKYKVPISGFLEDIDPIFNTKFEFHILG